MGHFGAAGCQRIVNALAAGVESDAPWTLLELGAGFGGAARAVGDFLAAAGREVATVIGIELVADMATVSQARRPTGHAAHFAPIVASVAAIPLADNSVDGVFASGSFSHFSDPGTALLEAARVGRPDAIVTFIDEVGIRKGDPGSAFLEHHPPTVFPPSRREDRIEQIHEAGLVDVDVADISAWAGSQLSTRARALRLYSEQLADFYGVDAATAISATIESARDEVLAGTVVPHQFTARVPGVH
jgi:SAM-dependent methyltransferase